MYNKFMEVAIEQAKKAYKKGEVPVGAVIVKDNKILAKAYNKIEINNCAAEHAEIIAIKKASKKLKNWRLIDCDIYITLEPCPMCSWALKLSRVRNVYVGATSLENPFQHLHCIKLDRYKKECTELLQDFFREHRK